MFKFLDSDMDGFVSRRELKEKMEAASYYTSDQEIELLLDRYDKNRDSRISFKEFTDELAPKLATY